MLKYISMKKKQYGRLTMHPILLSKLHMMVGYVLSYSRELF